MNNLRIIGTKKNNLRIMNINLSVCYSTQTSAHYIACKELTLPKAVVLGLNLKVQGCLRSWQLIFAESAHCSPRSHCVASVARLSESSELKPVQTNYG